MVRETSPASRARRSRTAPFRRAWAILRPDAGAPQRERQGGELLDHRRLLLRKLKEMEEGKPLPAHDAALDFRRGRDCVLVHAVRPTVAGRAALSGTIRAARPPSGGGGLRSRCRARALSWPVTPYRRGCGRALESAAVLCARAQPRHRRARVGRSRKRSKPAPGTGIRGIVGALARPGARDGTEERFRVHPQPRARGDGPLQWRQIPGAHRGTSQGRGSGEPCVRSTRLRSCPQDV